MGYSVSGFEIFLGGPNMSIFFGIELSLISGVARLAVLLPDSRALLSSVW